MAGKEKNFEIIKEGFAKARFGGLFSGGVVAGTAEPIKLAAVDNNGDLNPEEYYACNCRLLSAAVTPYRKFDFTKEGVLQAAVPLFEGLTLYANHDADVTAWKGFIQEPVWDSTNKPNGINAMAVIDRTVDPQLARGVETKALRSFSVTIWFAFEKSHPDLANFYDRLGEVVDGQMVRMIVTNISNAGEVSVVWEGEDPFAKSFAVPAGDGGQHHITGGSDMKLTAATLAVLGITAGTDVTEEMLETKINEKVQALESRITTLTPDADLGKQLLAETRLKAATLYKTLKGDKVVETFITSVIDKADLVTARALCSEYEAEVDKTVPLKCPKCGEGLARRSSMEIGARTVPAGKNLADYKL